jgi:hypothetical protein
MSIMKMLITITRKRMTIMSTSKFTMSTTTSMCIRTVITIIMITKKLMTIMITSTRNKTIRMS